jgi:VWFA-related protein
MTRRTIAAMLLLSVTAAAQQVGQNKAALQGDGTMTLKVTTKLVVETVTVKDKQGSSIEGLTKDDFVVTEDGAPQTVRIFEHQQLPDTPAVAPRPGTQENVHIYNRLGRTEIAPEAATAGKYRDRRLMALYFDMTAMPQEDQLRSILAAQKFVRTQMQTADMFAILRYAGGSVDVLQDFTDNRDRLLSILETLAVGEGQGFDQTDSSANASDSGAAFGQNDSEFNIFNTDRQLAALQTAANMLSRLNEKKSLIYFASGLRLNGLDNQAQLHATINEAIRAGVSFWPIDARGLVAEAPLGDATKGSPGGAAMYSGAAAGAAVSRFQQSQDTLYALAADTGGKAMFDNNDLTRGITQAQKSVSNYYIVGYYTTNPAMNGKFRKIKISLKNDTAATLDYRQGYYAGKEFSKFTEIDKERQLEDALMLPDPITELTIAMEVDYFQLNRAEYFVPVVVKIPGRELALAKRGGSEHTLIDFIGEIKDAYGTTVSNLRDRIDIKLSDTTVAELAKRPIEYDTGYTLFPGKYTLKFLARDNETGRIGTYQTNFTIPNLTKEVVHVPESAVVLSSQRVDQKAAIYDVAKDKERAKQNAVNPLVIDNKKIIPSVTRVISRSREMYVYLQGYDEGTPSGQPLLGYVSFYQGQKKIYDTHPVEVVRSATSRVGAASMMFSVGLGPLPPGSYECQVSVLDPASQKSTFWQATVVIIP